MYIDYNPKTNFGTLLTYCNAFVAGLLAGMIQRIEWRGSTTLESAIQCASEEESYQCFDQSSNKMDARSKSHKRQKGKESDVFALDSERMMDQDHIHFTPPKNKSSNSLSLTLSSSAFMCKPKDKLVSLFLESVKKMMQTCFQTPFDFPYPMFPPGYSYGLIGIENQVWSYDKNTNNNDFVLICNRMQRMQTRSKIVLILIYPSQQA